MRYEKVHVNENKDVILTAYLLDSSDAFSNISSRPAILILPGGGYFNTSDREAEPIAMAYLAEGFNTFILRYSVGTEHTFDVSFKDAQDAISILKDNAQKWNIAENKIAVIGFSAGGHLAAALGTMGRIRPNALLLGYPCILSSMSDILAFAVPSLEKEVDEFTPPTFIFSSFEDQLVPVNNTIQFMQALNEKNIPFESHIFQRGTHGLSLSKALTSSGLTSFVDNDFAQWFDMSISWLHKIVGNFPAVKES
ncbi:alpha/beta hydrolase [Bacillus sp. FJAT-49711]|uniref:alpha/beta hydrolase n=1 Tax=Bacillus sp. FJAT-49711 TaxID=2833585 RepID=UPI001BC904F5|nr:alpha/beta hydrolase [Bacillus sp. FJAT-49711]MBS4217596.1 alpha/beta hydrolase [Bacillus sp. FJAT-49711]